MIRILLLVYPRSWRQRYAAELSQLVDDVGLSPRIALDVIAAGIAERFRSLRSTIFGGTQMVIGPAWRHPRGLALLAVVVIAPVTAFVVGSLLAYQLGIAPLVGPLESVGAWLAARHIDSFLVVSPAVALLLAAAPIVRLELRPTQTGTEAIVGLRLRLANLAVGGLALVIGGVLAWYFVAESFMERGA